MKKTLVINLFGAPGAGKSTGAAYIFYKLKTLGVDCELVTEFAKELVWDDSEAINNQAYVYGTQSNRMSRLKDKVDVIITDSPLLLAIYYGYLDWNKTHISFPDIVLEDFNTYKNFNFFLKRVKPYNPNGRYQTEEESNQIEKNLIELLDFYNVDYKTIEGSTNGYDIIIEDMVDVLEFEGILK